MGLGWAGARMPVADFCLFHGVHLEFACAALVSASRSWRTGHRKIKTPDSASQNASSPCFARMMLSASAEIEHISPRDRSLVDSCRFRLACPRIRRVGIPASMEVLPEQPIFCWPGVLVLGQIENYSQRYRKLHLKQEKHTPKPSYWH